ncbi:MAG: hypothetical protein JHC57_02115 [Sphingopyxis sp.]|nr:hypothetical protein [Sphingopyxis sp.]MBJ7498529.1 hypothetical protein [Sphingopyxis sp.]
MSAPGTARTSAVANNDPFMKRVMAFHDLFADITAKVTSKPAIGGGQ